MQELPIDQQFKRVTCELVETKGLVLTDDAGLQRASLSCVAATDGKPGHTVCHIYDSTGAPKISLQVSDKDGQHITLFNSQNNSPAISLTSNSELGNGITITNGNGQPLISIAVHGQSSQLDPNTSEIIVSNSEQNETWSVENGTQRCNNGK